MAKNKVLRNSRKKENKRDEFYTMYKDVEKELSHYTDQLKNKIVYCNCDNPEDSMFWNYLHINFTKLSLKKLIATFYSKEKESFIYYYEGGNDSDVKYLKKQILEGDGDFRSKSCVNIMIDSDIIVTNPPFSLFTEFINQLEFFKKKYIVWGNLNAVTYKDIFNLIKSNKLWFGVIANNSCDFKIPLDYPRWNKKFTKKMNDGNHYGKVPSITVFTNIKVEKNFDLKLTKKYNPDDYPKYDNYNAINVNKLIDIPIDYDGIIGVPITFIKYFQPEIKKKKNQKKSIDSTEKREYLDSIEGNMFNHYSILGIMNTGENNFGIKYDNAKDGRPLINGKFVYLRILIKQKENS